MTLARLRRRIASLWCGFWILTSICVILSPILRRDEAVGYEDVLGILGQISGIWLPPLSCFVAFWFPAAERKSSRKRHVDSERVFGALALTLIFMILVFVLLLLPLYFIKYQRNDMGNLYPGQTLTERISDMVKFSLLLSPLILAPVSWLTGGHSGVQRKQRSDDEQVTTDSQ